MFSITIKTPQTPESSAALVARMAPSDTVLALKAWLAARHPQQPRVSEQRLVSSGRLLADAEALKDCQRIDDNGAVVHLVVAVRAGECAGGREERQAEAEVAALMAGMEEAFRARGVVPQPRIVLVDGKPHLLQMTLDSHSVPPQQPRTQFPPIIDATQLSLQQSVSRSVPSIDPVGPVPPTPALPNIAVVQPVAPAIVPAQPAQPVQPAPNAANANVGIVGHVAAAFHHLFGDHDEDEFGDAAALLAVQQQQEALNAAAGGGGNAANGDAALQMAIRRRVEHPFYLAIKLSFLVYMITRGGVSSRSMIIMGAACVFFVIQFRAWYLQLRPQQPQQPRATPVATAADSPTQQLHGVHETTVFQETYYFIHDFFASLFPESDDYLYNRERRGDVAQAAVAADQQQQAQPAMAFI